MRVDVVDLLDVDAGVLDSLLDAADAEPSGGGSVMWCASQVMAPPRYRRGCEPRA